MITYIATFYSHYGAIQFRRNCEGMNLEPASGFTRNPLSRKQQKKWNRSSEWNRRDMWGFIMRMMNDR